VFDVASQVDPVDVGAPSKIGVLILVALALAAPCMAQTTSEAPPKPPPVLNDEQLFHKYMMSTFGAPGVLNAMMAGGLTQWQHDPPEWGSGKAGYANRWSSSFAEAAIGSTTTYAVARLLHHDPSFTRCQCKGFGPRLRHALISPFTARTRRGRRVLSPAIVAGLAAESIVPPATWYPAPHGTVGGIGHTALSVASKMGVDVLREFIQPPHWPKR
jgi:hypothetical protein